MFPHQEAGFSLWSQQPLRLSDEVRCARKMGTGTAQIREAYWLVLESKAMLGVRGGAWERREGQEKPCTWKRVLQSRVGRRWGRKPLTLTMSTEKTWLLLQGGLQQQRPTGCPGTKETPHRGRETQRTTQRPAPGSSFLHRKLPPMSTPSWLRKGSGEKSTRLISIIYSKETFLAHQKRLSIFKRQR